jgi:hypothetical protein
VKQNHVRGSENRDRQRLFCSPIGEVDIDGMLANEPADDGRPPLPLPLLLNVASPPGALRLPPNPNDPPKRLPPPYHIRYIQPN